MGISHSEILHCLSNVTIYNRFDSYRCTKINMQRMKREREGKRGIYVNEKKKTRKLGMTRKKR